MTCHRVLVPQPWHTLPLKHVVESQQFDLDSLDVIFDTALEMENIRPGTPESKQLEGIVMSTLFYEPSTRTRLSFESAMSRLGGTVLSTESAGEYSSAAKGETLEGELLSAPSTSTLRLTETQEPSATSVLLSDRHHPDGGGVRRLHRAAALPVGLRQASSSSGVGAHHQRWRRRWTAPHPGMPHDSAGATPSDESLM